MLPKISNNELRKYHRAGLSVREIVLSHGNISRIAIYNRLKKLGLAPNPSRTYKLPNLDDRTVTMIDEIIHHGGKQVIEEAVEELYIDMVAI